MVSGVVGKKFEPAAYEGFRVGAGTLFKSAVYLTFTISFVVVMFGLARYSRVQVFATCGVLLGLEMVVWAVAVHFGVRPQVIREDGEEAQDEKVPAVQDGFSFKFAMVDLGFYEFLSTHVNLKDIMSVETLVDRTCEPFSIRGSPATPALYQYAQNKRQLAAQCPFSSTAPDAAAGGICDRICPYHQDPL